MKVLPNGINGADVTQFGKQLALRIATDINNWKEDYLDYKGLKTASSPTSRR